MNRMGYACINMKLSSQKPKIYTGRSMIKRTFKAKGIEYASELGLANCKDLFERISKEIKEVWQQRNDAIRSYNGLIEMGKSARDLGIDTKDWKLPEEEKDKFKDYKFSIDHKVLESGKVQYAAKLTKRKNNDE